MKLDSLKEALLGRFEVRKTDAQKTAFIEWAAQYAKKCGAEMRIEESGRFVKTRNLVFGNPDGAKTLITAHYDTCARMPVPNFMTPACWPVILMTQGLLPAALFTLLGFAMSFVCTKGLTVWMPAETAEIVAPLICSAAIFAVIALMLFGPQNPHTANDNTSGVALALLLLETYAQRDDVAVILFDNEEKGMLGSAAFVKAHPGLKKQAVVINLDCISDGDTLLYAYAKAAKPCAKTQRIIAALEETAPRYGKRVKIGQSPKVFYPSDQMSFVRGTAFAALKGEKLLYLDRIHTARDTVFDDANLLCLAEVIEHALG